MKRYIYIYAKMCCETANEISYIKTNIQFVKEGNST